jgi:predicted ATP-grasp superfamily ATP-dependent carboligase
VETPGVARPHHVMSALVLDGNQRSALAVTRALGRRGIPVIVAGETRTTLAGASRYRQDTFTYPAPHEQPERFIDTIRTEAAARGVGLMMPMTDLTTHLVLRHREQFENIAIPSASFETFEMLTDKRRLIRLAQGLGVPVPATYVAEPGEDLSRLPAGFGFPLVLKPSRSTMWTGRRWIAASVHYADSLRHAQDLVARHEYFSRQPFLVQEYIRGHAQGMFALYDRGTPVAFFAHRRLREKPPSGGVSVLSESIEIDGRLREAARRILDHVRWHGVAMVEFKVGVDGSPYLIEVNARFWGSLQLAIDAGVDFPYLLYRLADGAAIDAVEGYQLGVRTRWLLGDLDHLYLTLRRRPRRDPTGPSRWRAVVQFLKIFARNTRYEVNRWDDVKPFLVELTRYIGTRS